jgi:serine/threonine protein kinase
MGTVYLAERDDGQFQQRVAIKVIKRGMDTDAVLRRFIAERQILARLQHPNITRLLDGGMFDGRPYFVMEYLEGQPIAEYCRRTHATIARRIELFLAVCDAVEHAHRNLILHRDLKPGNILVDSTGAVKLLDFGIAKLLEAEGSTEQTALAARAMTPQAASPEQVRGEALTTASDVYSLGLLLYELLAGKPPYAVPAGPASEVARIVCEQPAPKASVMTARASWPAICAVT